MLDAQFYNLTQEAGSAIFGALLAAQARSSAQPEPPPAVLQVRRGLAESPGWFLIQASEFAPEPLTVDALRVRDIYASERIVAAMLELMASEQWLDRDAQGAYHLAEAGRSWVERLRPLRHAQIAALEEPLRPGEVARLAELLRQTIDASLASSAPPGAWCLALSRRRAPAADAPPLVQIFQYVEDINAFRDDAHMAAWRAHDIAGDVWESFAYVVDGQASSAEAQFEQLAYRGYSRAERAAALEELARRGWIARAADQANYQATELGRAVHADVERQTNAYFYAPWTCLAEDDIALAHDLLTRLRDRFQETSGA
jgi:DNA-binding MarR family transcriptional regulator